MDLVERSFLQNLTNLVESINVGALLTGQRLTAGSRREDAAPPAPPPEVHRDLSVGGGVLPGVVQEDMDHLPELSGVAGEPDAGLHAILLSALSCKI